MGFLNFIKSIKKSRFWCTNLVFQFHIHSVTPIFSVTPILAQIENIPMSVWKSQIGSLNHSVKLLQPKKASQLSWIKVVRSFVGKMTFSLWENNLIKVLTIILYSKNAQKYAQTP